MAFIPHCGVWNVGFCSGSMSVIIVFLHFLQEVKVLRPAFFDRKAWMCDIL